MPLLKWTPPATNPNPDMPVEAKRKSRFIGELNLDKSHETIFFFKTIEPQNIEGWFRYAQSFYKLVRIHFFDIRHSTFMIRYSIFAYYIFFFDQTGHLSGQQ
jgi:hypothetical protein